MNENEQVEKKFDIEREVVRTLVVDAARNGVARNPDTPKILHQCGTRFDFSNPRKIVVNDKKRNLRFTMTMCPDTDDKTVDYNWNLVFDRNDGRKIKKLMNSERWRSAVERIHSQIT
jgi:hypothetical protein